MITSMIRCFLSVACIAAVLGSAPPIFAQQDPLAAAFAERNGELGAIKAALAAAENKRGELEQDVRGIGALLTSSPDLTPAQRAELADPLARATLRLERHARLAGVRIFVDKVSQATDAAYALGWLAQALRDDDGGADLRALSGAVARTGTNSVGFAERIDAYHGAVADLIAAIDKLARALDVMRAEARLGSQAYGGTDDPRYRRLIALSGQTFVDAATYVPSSPWEVFRPVRRSGGQDGDVVLIWDAQEQDWYRIEGSVPVEAIFRDAYLALDRRPTPGKLKYLAENFGQVKGQEAAADAFSAYLSEAGRQRETPQNQAFSRAPEGGLILAILSDPATFRARFVYDAAFRAFVLKVLDELRHDLVAQGSRAEPALRGLDALTSQHGVTLDSQWSQGFLPETGSIRVVAWFSDNPRNKFVSTWQFEREKVLIDVNNGDVRNNGYAQGIRNGNIVRSERSIPGRNCIASDERVFEQGGTLTFSSVYVCTLNDGTTQTNKVAGAGTWHVVSPATSKGASRSTR